MYVLESDTCSDHAEIIWIEIPVKRSKIVSVGCFYQTKETPDSMSGSQAIWANPIWTGQNTDTKSRICKPQEQLCGHAWWTPHLPEFNGSNGEYTFELFVANIKSLVNNGQVIQDIWDICVVIVTSIVCNNKGKQNPWQIPWWNMMKQEKT